jgi:hypothetical protein
MTIQEIIRDLLARTHAYDEPDPETEEAIEDVTSQIKKMIEDHSRRAVMLEMSASEALFGFCAWLTTRSEEVHLGSEHDAAPVVECIKRFMETNGLGNPRDGWENNFTHPG